MNDEAVREKLAAALPESLGPVGLRRRAIPELEVRSATTGYGVALIDALLPVVREIAAEELREAADALTDRVPTWVLNDLRDRADALDGTR